MYPSVRKNNVAFIKEEACVLEYLVLAAPLLIIRERKNEKVTKQKVE